MPKRKPATEESPSFEESLAELEEIVEAMEHESLPLEKLVESYEQGSRLLARCETVLRSARQRLETIALRARPGDDPETPAEAIPADAAPAIESDEDDIRLF